MCITTVNLIVELKGEPDLSFFEIPNFVMESVSSGTNELNGKEMV